MRKSLLIVSVAVFGLSFGGGEQAVSTFTDKRDGKVYRIVEIGGAVWMAENLNYDAEGSVCYENSADSCAKYGRLYDWAAALKACPAGTHLPDDDEWTTLVNYAGMIPLPPTLSEISDDEWTALMKKYAGGEKNAGKKLKSKAGWNNNGNGTDDYGWSALPGGSGRSDGSFNYAGDDGCWWSATEGGATNAWYRNMTCYFESVYRYSNNKTYLYSVRCVADKEAQK